VIDRKVRFCTCVKQKCTFKGQTSPDAVLRITRKQKRNSGSGVCVARARVSGFTTDIRVIELYTLFICGSEIVLKAPGSGDTLRVLAAGDAPIASVVSTTALAIAKVVGVVIIDIYPVTDVSSCPALAGKG
jgi:hypothetical protein